MIKEQFKNFNIILASGSPRRQQFFTDMGLDFEVRLKSVEELYPQHLKAAEISDFLSQLKAKAFVSDLKPNDILITSDTVVWHNNESLAKAKDFLEAKEMLTKLSGNWHQVITSVCFTTAKKQEIAHSITEVKFKKLTSEEITYYIEEYQPYDKAGAYGIQEWIGLIGIEEIKGSYTNVVGLPTQLTYNTLLNMVK
ncbi:septum formation protein [Maribacter sedimenticola]|uniref:dTTP/UTP pyrophosphatase n=1 Tax=Maribacter sedimenticola TaxID=228956 RepID=A0ABY1SH61_9FLAO|nr:MULTISPECIES: Maf family nucleotide pyrophosphatase [Maribacter]TVZ14112.1 septum formation protein [Maribacter sp. MAR_2009_72]SNR48519.1 septum formation protein [Maribacter sedimenticola]